MTKDEIKALIDSRKVKNSYFLMIEEGKYERKFYNNYYKSVYLLSPSLFPDNCLRLISSGLKGEIL
jgi:hypothetical protein